MEPLSSAFKIVVTKADFDDMGQILQKMGFPFRVYDLNQLSAAEAMRNVDILFINCQGPEPTWEAAKNIRQLVERGGALYVSCYARKWLELIWPDHMVFHAEGEIQEKLPTRIIDTGLQEFLGGIKELYLRYNTHWCGIKKIKVRDGPNAVYEYMRGTRQGTFEDEALLVSFPFGYGFVIFTTFHNSHQVSELESRLLQYLVLRPLLASKTFESNTIILQKSFTPTKELLGSLSVGEESKLYNFFTKKVSDLKFIFNWKGKATAKVTIFDPTGRPALEENVRSSPKEIDLTNCQPGQWTFKMKIVDAPLTHFPFTINVGIKDAVEKQLNQENFSAGPINLFDPKGHKIAEKSDESSFPAPLVTEQPVVIKPNKRSISIKIIYPTQQLLKTVEIEQGRKYIFGREWIPAELKGRESVSGKHFVFQYLEPDQLLIEDISSYGTGAAAYQSEKTETTALMKNIPVAYNIPVLVNLAGVILILFT